MRPTSNDKQQISFLRRIRIVWNGTATARAENNKSSICSFGWYSIRHYSLEDRYKSPFFTTHRKIDTTTFVQWKCAVENYKKKIWAFCFVLEAKSHPVSILLPIEICSNQPLSRILFKCFTHISKTPGNRTVHKKDHFWEDTHSFPWLMICFMEYVVKPYEIVFRLDKNPLFSSSWCHYHHRY